MSEAITNPISGSPQRRASIADGFPVKSFEFNGPPKKLLRLSDGERADLTSALAQANTRKSLSQTIELSRNMSLRYVPTITHDPKERPPLASPKELNGWYIYDWANGAFFYSALNFIALLITAQAAATAKKNFCGDCLNNEWAEDYESKGDCVSGRQYTTNSSCMAVGGVWNPSWKRDALYVYPLGKWLPIGYASFSMFCTTISVICQLVVFISGGGLADYGNNRKKMLMITNTLGSIGCIFVIVTANDGMYWFNGLMLIIANVSFGFAVVFYNAYLPLLSEAHPEVVTLLDKNAPEDQVVIKLQEVSNRISARGFATGFSGQFFVLVTNMILFLVLGTDDTLSTRLNCMFAGLWTLVFGAVCFARLLPRPGGQLPEGETYCSIGIKRVTETVKSRNKLSQMFVFLLAYFIFSDGASTIAQSAAIFAQVELGMDNQEIIIGILEVSVVAILSCAIFFYLNNNLGVKPKTILIINLVCMGAIPLYGIIAMRQKWEFYLLVFIFGLQTGSQQAFTRSIFSACIPKGHEAEYFSFYEITDKGTAWMGPLSVGMIFSITGSYRSAFAVLIVFFVVGIFVLTFFDFDKALEQKRQFEIEEQAAKDYEIQSNSKQ